MEQAAKEYARNVRSEAEQRKIMEESKELAAKYKETQLSNANLLISIDTCRRRITRLRQERNLLVDKICEQGLLPPAKEIHSDDSECDSDEYFSDLPASRFMASPSSNFLVRKRPASAGEDGGQDSIFYGTGSNGNHISKSFKASKGARKAADGGFLTIDQPNPLTPLKKLNVVMGADGKPMLPLSLGVVTLVALGQVEWQRESFHNKRYVWPIGFHTTRNYPSCVDPDQPAALYHSRILDGGIAGPIFQVELDASFIAAKASDLTTETGSSATENAAAHTASSSTITTLGETNVEPTSALHLLEKAMEHGDAIAAPDARATEKGLQTVFQSATPTGAWTAVSRQVASIRRKDHPNSTSGPDFFGLSSTTISTLIEGLSGVEHCVNYQRRLSRPTGSSKQQPEVASHQTLSSYGDPDDYYVDPLGFQSHQ